MRVYPNAARSEVVGFIDGALRIRVVAPPAKGKANRELIAFLSQVLGIGRSRIHITKGHTTRNKLIAISGLSQEDIIKQLLPSD